MNTCKAALRVIWANRGAILGYLLGCSVMMIAMCVGIINTMTSNQVGSDTFTPSTASVGIIDRDAASGHTFKRGIERAVTGSAEFVDIDDTTRDMQDAVATDRAKLIVIIPQHYARDFADAVASGSEVPQVETVTSYSSGSAAMAGIEIQGFLGSVETALASGAADDVAEAIDYVVERQADAPRVRVADTGDSAAEDGSAVTVAAFTMMMGIMVYSVLSVMILATGFVVSRFNEVLVRARLSAAPQSSVRVNGQIMLACAVWALIVWVYFAALSLGFTAVMRGGLQALGVQGAGAALGAAFAFTVMTLAFGFMVGQFGLPATAINGIANVVGLALLFLSGAMISPSLMPDAMVTLAKFTPGWWYVDAVYQSFGGRDATNVGKPDWGGWGLSITVVLLFAVVFVCVGLAVGRVRQSKSVVAGPALTTVQ